MATLKRGKDGRWYNTTAKRWASKAEIAVHTGAGDDTVVIVDQSGSGKGGGARRGSGTARSTGGGGGGTSIALSTEPIQRIKVEIGWDLVHGLLWGLLERAQAKGYDVRQAAARLYELAHMQGTAAQNRDAKQFEIGRTLGSSELIGLVAVHLGWTAETWGSVVPPELLQVGRLSSGAGSILQSDDWQDEGAGTAGSVLGGEIGEALGIGVGGIFGGPAGAAAGATAGELLGTFIGRQAGVAGSNMMQGERPSAQGGGAGLVLPQLQHPTFDFASPAQVAATIP